MDIRNERIEFGAEAVEEGRAVAVRSMELPGDGGGMEGTVPSVC